MSDAARAHRYQRVSQILREEIEGGIFRIGERIPSEQSLCGRFDVSRFTIREALKQLCALGMVKRRQGSGTVVGSSQPRNAYVQRVGNLEELVDYGQNTHLNVEADWPVSAASAPVALPSGEPWHCIRVRRTDFAGYLICVADVFVPGRFAALADAARSSHLPVFQTLERQFGVKADDITVDIAAITASPEQAKVLGKPVGSPVLRVTRTYLDDRGAALEISLADHPADQFKVSFALERQD